MIAVLVQERRPDGSVLTRDVFSFQRIPCVGEWVITEKDGDEEAFKVEEVVHISAGGGGGPVTRIIGRPGLPPR